MQLVGWDNCCDSYVGNTYRYGICLNHLNWCALLKSSHHYSCKMNLWWP